MEELDIEKISLTLGILVAVISYALLLTRFNKILFLLIIGIEVIAECTHLYFYASDKYKAVMSPKRQ